jgi:hypothetical protein
MLQKIKEKDGLTEVLNKTQNVITSTNNKIIRMGFL